MKRLWLPGGFVAAILLVALLAPILDLPNPIRQDIARRLSGPIPGSPLGRDEFGRDVLSRLIWGARTSLGVAFVSAFLSGHSVGSWYAGLVRRLIESGRFEIGLFTLHDVEPRLAETARLQATHVALDKSLERAREQVASFRPDVVVHTQERRVREIGEGVAQRVERAAAIRSLDQCDDVIVHLCHGGRVLVAVLRATFPPRLY